MIHVEQTEAIDWKRVRWFESWEFAEDPDLHAEPQLIYCLDAFRNLLGTPVHPSKARGALARTGPDASRTSQHYAGEGRKSRAADVFPDCEARHAFAIALSQPCWGGIGLYFDTRKSINEPHYMMHLDLRPIEPGARRVLWYRINGKYTYPASPEQLLTMFHLAERGGP